MSVVSSLLQSLGLGADAAALAADCAASWATMPSGDFSFLERSYVVAACRDVDLSEEISTAAVGVAQRVASDPALRLLAWHCHHCLFIQDDYPADKIRCWPALIEPLHEQSGLFYLLVLLSGLPTFRKIYRARAIPRGVASDTLFDVQRRLDEYRRDHGVWGLTPRHLSWLRQHMKGAIYHLDRLQFAPGAFRTPVRVFRHRQSERTLALSETGVPYRGDGQLDGAGGVFDPSGAWAARLVMTSREIVGTPILSTGSACSEEVRLPATEWQEVLAPGAPVLHLHIPAGGPMDFDRCGTPFRAALQFFPRHFPERPFVAFTCSSWLLDAQFSRLLPPSSNIVRFQQEVYLLPGNAEDRTTLVRLFGQLPDDLKSPVQAPRDTTLRRAVLDHLAAGGHLRGGRCFLLPADLRWGDQVYRRQAETWSR